MIISYRVKIGYKDFDFDDAIEAMDFAKLAKIHYVSEKGEQVDVEIEIVIVPNDDIIQEVNDNGNV